MNIKENTDNIKNLINSRFTAMVLEDDDSRHTQAKLVYLMLAFVSAYMTVANAITGYTSLMLSTIVFCILMLANLFLCVYNAELLALTKILFAVEDIVLMCIFIITGTPEGFSAIWMAMVPPIVLLMYRRRHAMQICSVCFLILVFFYWLPFGKDLLLYEYTASWRLRFPLYFLAVTLLCYVLISADKIQRTELRKTKDELHALLQVKEAEIARKNKKLDRLIPHYYAVKTDKDTYTNVCLERLEYITMQDHRLQYFSTGETEPVQSVFIRTSFREAVQAVTVEKPTILTCGASLAINMEQVKSIEGDAIILNSGKKLFPPVRSLKYLTAAWMELH